jgi:hypothetical protein
MRFFILFSFKKTSCCWFFNTKSAYMSFLSEKPRKSFFFQHALATRESFWWWNMIRLLSVFFTEIPHQMRLVPFAGCLRPEGSCSPHFTYPSRKIIQANEKEISNESKAESERLIKHTWMNWTDATACVSWTRFIHESFFCAGNVTRGNL